MSYSASDEPTSHDEDQQRAERLANEWLNVEKVLDEENVEHTLVFFGSARLTPTETGELAGLYEDAEALAFSMSQHLVSTNALTTKVITGGGPGLMEAVNKGAYRAGLDSIGLNICLPREQQANPYIGDKLQFDFHYFSMRKMHFLKRAKVIVAFPGGFGTLDEILETLTLVQTGKIDKLPIIFYGKSFWQRLIDFSYLVECGLIDEQDIQLFEMVDSVAEAESVIKKCLN